HESRFQRNSVRPAGTHSFPHTHAPVPHPAGLPMHRRTSALVLLPALAAGLAVTAPARAQAVHGTLVDPAGRPVEQVLVALVDANGRPAGGALTSAAGEFH